MGHRKPDSALGKTQAQIQLSQTKSQTWTGPLPSPDDIARFEKVLPGAAERIFALAEGEAAHRRSIESTELASDDADRKTVRAYFNRGQWMGFVIAIGTVSASVWLIARGNTVTGSILAGTTIISLVTIFVIGKQDDSEKKK